MAEEATLDVYNSGTGIGDAVCGVYAAAGAARLGRPVRFFSRKAEWLSRVSFPGLEILNGPDNGVDMNEDYAGQMRAGGCRKQWYCDNISRLAGVAKFKPAAPLVTDRDIDHASLPGAKYVLLSPFSAYESRVWPAMHWARLAHLLMEAGKQVVVLGGSGDKDKLTQVFGSTRATWFYGNPPSWVMNAVLGADLVVGNDSGIAHLAGMLKVRTLAIHAQVTAEQLFSFTGIRSAIPKASCVGCTWNREKGWQPVCNLGCSALASISAEQVAEEIS